MKYLRSAFVAAILVMAASSAWAQTPNRVTPGYMTTTGCPGTTIPCFVPVLSNAVDWSNSATVGTTHAQVLAANVAKVYLLLHNPSAPGGNIVYCAFGATAVANAAGTVSIAPGQYLTFESNAVPRSAMDCIASGTSTPFTVGVE